jgi:hypothetical protein
MKALTTTREEAQMSNRPPYPGTPRWVKVFGIIVIVVILLIAAVMFVIGGEHGPGRHAQSGNAGGRVPPSSVMEAHAPLEGGRG